jgi:hypothetical protein
MARPSRNQVLSAQCNGIAAGVAHTRRCTAEEGLEEIRRELGAKGIKLGTPEAVAILTHAAMMYAVDTPQPQEWWFPAAFEFLVGAGADLAQARELRRNTRIAGPVGPHRTQT